MNMKYEKSFFVLMFLMVGTLGIAFGGEEEQPSRNWRISGGVRYAPRVKSKGRMNLPAAMNRAGGRFSGNLFRRDILHSTESWVPDGVMSKEDAEAGAGFLPGSTKYDYDNGHIILDDVSGSTTETRHWHFDDGTAYDDASSSIIGTRAWGLTTRQTDVTTEYYAGGRGSERSSGLYDTSDEDALGFYLEAERTLWESESGRFGLGISLGYTLYHDVDCFSFTVHNPYRIRTSTRVMTTEESGAYQTIISQPDFNREDITNPDGSIGGDSKDGIPTLGGYTPIFTVDPGNFSTSIQNNDPLQNIMSSMSDISGSAADALNVTAHASAKLSLQEFRFGVNPYWQVCEWAYLRGGLGALVEYTELQGKSELYVNGSRAYAQSRTEREWGLRGYAGLSVGFLLTDWMELSVGAEGRFPNRKIHYNDGVVSGDVELPDWDLYSALTISF